MRSVLIAIAYASAVFLAPGALAGEIDCRFNCEISTFSTSLEWKPTGCYEPSPPYFYVSDVDSYNRAVEEFNFYLSEVNSYIDCVIRDAKADLKKLPDIVRDGITKARSKVMMDVDSARSQLEISRLYLR